MSRTGLDDRSWDDAFFKEIADELVAVSSQLGHEYPASRKIVDHAIIALYEAHRQAFVRSVRDPLPLHIKAKPHGKGAARLTLEGPEDVLRTAIARLETRGLNERETSTPKADR